MLLWAQMICPHCTNNFHPQFQETPIHPGNFNLFLYHQNCPACAKPILEITGRANVPPHTHGISRITIYPATKMTRPVAPEIEEPYRRNFTEAIQVLPTSPNGSALLSRRLLQAILRQKAGCDERDLYKQIIQAEDKKEIPPYIHEGLHYVRMAGNLAAHPTPDSSGELWDVTDDEATLTLNIVEMLLDFYFVRPALIKKQKEELQNKLKPKDKDENSTPPNPS